MKLVEVSKIIQRAELLCQAPCKTYLAKVEPPVVDLFKLVFEFISNDFTRLGLRLKGVMRGMHNLIEVTLDTSLGELKMRIPLAEVRFSSGLNG